MTLGFNLKLGRDRRLVHGKDGPGNCAPALLGPLFAIPPNARDHDPHPVKITFG